MVIMTKKRTMGILMALMLVMFASVAIAQDLNKVNINTASVEELTQLKRIGTSYAQRIIEYRDKNGPFEKPEDIVKVPGIGPKTFQANYDIIVVN